VNIIECVIKTGFMHLLFNLTKSDVILFMNFSRE